MQHLCCKPAAMLLLQCASEHVSIQGLIMSKVHYQCEHYWYQNYYIYLLISKFTKYMLMPLHTHSISFNYIYHNIYTIFENALIALCILYQNFGEPSIPVPILYHVVIPAQHWYWTRLCIWYLSPLGGVLFIKFRHVFTTKYLK